MGLVKSALAATLACFSMSFAQWGGGFGGFGGDQSASGKQEYSEKFADVNYVGDGKTFHNLDIYIPKEAKDSYPVVIHTYGSAWSMNNSKGSADINTICAGFLKAGFAVVTPNHRSASDAIYPAALHDIKAVVRFVRGNAAKYKFDTNFVAVSGFSSGGHLSSLTATTCGMKEGKSGSVTVDLEGNLGEFTSFSSCVDAACLWSPPTDIYTMNPINSFGGSGTFEGAFIGVEREGNKDKWMVASSPYYASEDDPPIIMFHGTSDQVVNIEQSQELYDSLQHHGVVSEFVKVSGGTHGGNEMYVAANLDKAVAFFETARAAKVTKTPETPKDTVIKDTLPADTAKGDTIPEFAKNLPGHSSFGLYTSGNRLFVMGAFAGERFRYAIFAMDGSLAKTGSMDRVLDMSRMKDGVYSIRLVSSNGNSRLVRFVKR